MKRAWMILGLGVVLAAGSVAAQDDAGKTKSKEEHGKPAEMKSAEAPDKPTGPQPAAKEAKSDAALTLARLAVCRNVEDRAPVGEAESFSGVDRLYCFTRVEGAHSPTRVYHRWYVGDRMVNEIPINVKGPRWRCWSQKTIRTGWHGDCRVEIVTEEGDVLGTKAFTIAAAEGATVKKEPRATAAEAKEKTAAEGESHSHEKDDDAGDDHEGHAHDDDHSGHDHD